MVKALDVPHAAAVEASIDDDGNVHIVLKDEKGNPFAGVVFTLNGAISTVEDLSDLIDDYIDKHDTIGPCIGSA
ncbi:hypothetical protein [Mesorhizobium sp. M1B.F.Ca.ET.045.04.1.1]|uniref:hypothetical protein n=1 Tax=Mesorhizobium sp. M1B.F.Ca.ET.045.04.1.1 TaxID=2493673 RepID=UPI000F762597|nr:hypothetical protein [Mesorhizobium sp. M1B.F.Ca.ET.045.04.1.1]AZO29353.1 hypothetical protein EJ071_19500 [Mesorhizobium sp. M1B.F.Ca.ET.045.04.1.1]